MFKTTKKIVFPIVFTLLFFNSCSQDDDSVLQESQHENSVSTTAEYLDNTTNHQINENSVSRVPLDPDKDDYCRMYPLRCGLDDNEDNIILLPLLPTDTETYTFDEIQLVYLIKAYRSGLGFNTISDNKSGITRIKAKEHNLYMINTYSVNHDGFNDRAAAIIASEKSFYYKIIKVAEIVAYNFDTPQEALEGWLASSEHKTILDDSSFTNFGLKISIHPVNGRKYYTVLFYIKSRIGGKSSIESDT